MNMNTIQQENNKEEGQQQPPASRKSSYAEFIATLPSDNSMRKCYRCYRNFWYLEDLLPHELAFHHTFQSRHSDILLVTQPKSGTTWLKALAFSILHRQRHPVHSPDHPLLVSNPHSCVPFNYSYYNVESQTLEVDSLASPRLLACHIPFSNLPASVVASDESAARIIYLCRDPKDTFISFWRFAREIWNEPYTLDEVLDVYCRGVSTYGPLWDHQLEYWQESLRRPDKVLFLKYEEMKEDNGGGYVKRMAEFMRCPFSREEEENSVVEGISELCSFERLSNLKVNQKGSWGIKLNEMERYEFENSTFFRRGEVGDWRKWMSEEMGKKLDEITEAKFRGSGHSFA